MKIQYSEPLLELLEIDSSEIKRLLLKKYFADTQRIVSTIVNENKSLPIEYLEAINQVATAQTVNLVDSTMKKVVKAGSSIVSDNDATVMLKSSQKSGSRTDVLKTANSSNFEKKLLAIMTNENYTSGEVSASESFVERTIQQMGADCTMGWLMQVYEANYHRPNILIGILHMLSHFSYNVVNPYGPIMALALLQHKSSSVREFAIKAFENWSNKDSLVFLKNIRCDQTWLQEYLNEVISDIEND